MADTTSIWQDLNDADYEQLADNLIIKYSKRGTRAFAYMLVSAVLLVINPFGVELSWGIVAVFGMLGFSSSSARIAQFGLFVLFVMALFPPDVIKAISAALTG